MPFAFDSSSVRLQGGHALWLRRAVELLLAVVVLAGTVRLALILAAGGSPAAAPPPPSVDTSILTRFDPFNRDGAVAAAGPAEALRLFGVRSGRAAIIAQADGVQRAYAVGDEVAPGLTLAAVGADHVVLSRGGVQSRLDFPPLAAAGAAIPPPAPAVTAPAAPSAAPSVEMPRLGQQIGLEPVDGGYRFVPRGGRGALAMMAGLRPGDVITAIDGRPLAPETAADLGTELAGRSQAQITVLRNGRPVTLTVQAPR